MQLTYILDYKNHQMQAVMQCGAAIKYECNLYRRWIFCTSLSLSPFLILLVCVFIFVCAIVEAAVPIHIVRGGLSLQLRMWEKKNFSSHLTNATLFFSLLLSLCILLIALHVVVLFSVENCVRSMILLSAAHWPPQQTTSYIRHHQHTHTGKENKYKRMVLDKLWHWFSFSMLKWHEI